MGERRVLKENTLHKQTKTTTSWSIGKEPSKRKIMQAIKKISGDNYKGMQMKGWQKPERPKREEKHTSMRHEKVLRRSKN